LKFQLISLVGSDFCCHSCLDSLNKAHQVKEKFLKNQEILIQNDQSFVDVLIKDEESDTNYDSAEQNVIDSLEDFQEDEVKVPTKSTKKKSAKKVTSRSNK
jgi:hypothetical protein